MADSKTTWLTQEAFDRLQEELDERSGPRRQAITKRIEAAREEGDLKENGGYHAAKDEQGHNEARILQLRHLIDNAEVGAPPSDDGEIAQGKVVTAHFLDFDEEETFLLGSTAEAGLTDYEVYTPDSPIGKALMGHKAGDDVEYTLPNGKVAKLKVLRVALP